MIPYSSAVSGLSFHSQYWRCYRSIIAADLFSSQLLIHTGVLLLLVLPLLLYFCFISVSAVTVLLSAAVAVESVQVATSVAAALSVYTGVASLDCVSVLLINNSQT